MLIYPCIFPGFLNSSSDARRLRKRSSITGFSVCAMRMALRHPYCGPVCITLLDFLKLRFVQVSFPTELMHHAFPDHSYGDHKQR